MIFTKEHLVRIADGKKTETRRVWKAPHVKIGGIYRTRSSRWFGYEESAPVIRVLEMRKEHLREITDAGALREGYPSIPEFVEAWLKLHGAWNPNLEVTVIRFEVVK